MRPHPRPGVLADPLSAGLSLLSRPRPGLLADPLSAVAPRPHPGVFADPIAAVAASPSGVREVARVQQARKRRRVYRIATAGLLAAACLGLALIVLSVSPRAKSPREGTILPFPTYVAANTAVEVSASFPKNHLSVPNRHGVAPIDAEGIDAQGFLGIPQDVGRVGVYTGAGKLDGTVGDVVIAGHVNWVGQGAGYLGDLDKLKPGDIVITRGTGAPTAWKITKVSMYLKSLGLPQSIFRAHGARTLTLVTCGGTLDTEAHSYLSNVVVTAEPVRTVIKALTR